MYIVPRIIHPSIPEEKQVDEYTFIPDGDYIKLTLEDAKLLGEDINNKNELIDILREYLEYYRKQLEKFEESIK